MRSPLLVLMDSSPKSVTAVNDAKGATTQCSGSSTIVRESSETSEACVNEKEVPIFSSPSSVSNDNPIEVTSTCPNFHSSSSSLEADIDIPVTEDECITSSVLISKPEENPSNINDNKPAKEDLASKSDDFVVLASKDADSDLNGAMTEKAALFPCEQSFNSLPSIHEPIVSDSACINSEDHPVVHYEAEHDIFLDRTEDTNISETTTETLHLVSETIKGVEQCSLIGFSTSDEPQADASEFHIPTSECESSENQTPSTPASCFRASHIRKSLRPRKLISYSTDNYEYADVVTENVIEPVLTEMTSNLTSSSPDHSVEQAVDIENARRRSLRPRRIVKQVDTFENEAELDKLLSDKVTLQAYGPAQHWNTGDYIAKNWVPVEKILSDRPLQPKKITNSILEAMKSFPAYQRHMAESEYFVKFHEQSFWHCAWVPGVLLLTLHPSMVRYYFKHVRPKNQESFLSSELPSSAKLSETMERPEDPNEGAVAKVSNTNENLNTPQDVTLNDQSTESNGCENIPVFVPHTSEEESDEENKISNDAEIQYDDVVNWTSVKPFAAGARRRYLLRWGVESYTLMPERIISMSAEFSLCDSIEAAEPYNWTDILYRDVLVKWLHLPTNQATWETIESDLDVWNLVASHPELARRKSIKLSDEPERKLLPLLVRRHLIRLMNVYCTGIATMLCEAYGTHKLPHKQTNATDPKDDSWKTHWIGEQPDYLSPVHRCKLHPYQIEGVRWLWHSYHNRVNAILADEMGLGKTVQVIALLYSLWKDCKDYGPFIVIAPLSTLLNWEREFQIWAPDFHVLVYSGDKNARTMMQDYEFYVPSTHSLAAFHVLITSHELACIERACLQGFHWSVLIVDEAHRLKNKQSRLFKETSQYKADFKILLTGTPLQNTLEELFHLLNFVEPKTFASFKALSEQWAEMPKDQRIAHLHSQLKHHLLRRLKVDVVQDLPKKTEILVFVDLTLLQRKLYKLILTKNYEELRSGSLMNSLVHLQKVCNHPYLLPAGDGIAPRLDPNQPDSPYEPKALVQVSGKLVVLMDMLSGLQSRGHRVLIYSRLTTMLDILEEVIINAGYNYERFDGSVKGPVRQIIIDRFNAPNSKAFVFLLSTRAGGEGINLASADTVILFDSDWNPQCDLQALSRAHRIGQSRHVVVYRFVTRNTMEERVYTVARRKLALTHLVVDQQQQRKQHRAEWRQRQAQAKQKQTVMEENQVTHPDIDKNEGDPVDDPSGAVSARSEVIPVTPQVGNRLSRAEMDEMLRCGVEALFATDDPLDDAGLFQAARNSGADNSKRIVYDAEAIANLLDRSNLSADSEQTVSAVDEYLSVFRVTHFDETEDPDGQSELPTSKESTAESHNPMEQSSKPPVPAKESFGYAAFWDRLLRERHMRLSNAGMKATEVSRRASRGVRRHGYSDNSDRSDEEVRRCDARKSGIDSRASHVDDMNHVRGEYLLRDGATISRRRHRLSDTHRSSGNMSVEVDHTPQMMSKVSTSGHHDEPHHSSSEDSFASVEIENVDQMSVHSDEDPLYVPSEESADEATLSDTGEKSDHGRSRHDRRKQHPTASNPSNTEQSDYAQDMYESRVSLFDETGRKRPWKPTWEIGQAWKQRISSLDPKITFENGHMFVYDFGPHDRQAFAGAVMRFGLPPPGVVPPQDWLPPSLYRKSPDKLFAYTSLFMRHLYDDPNGMDESKNYWSDGLPKENICVPAVLSRIAIMALIRNKVLEFEDINGVHSRTFEAVSTRFKFTIHEGGLTLLRPTWHEEWQRINRMVQPVASNVQSWSSATKKREEAMYHLQHTWHSRHDFWLLAAIHVHGYLRWTEILTDPRFHLLCTGLEGVLEDIERKDNPSFVAIPDSLLSTQHNIAKAQGFLLTRLRLLEQAIVVEQALREVARAALSGSVDLPNPPLTRVQNLTVCLSNKLAAAGPKKRIALPKEPHAREATRNAVMALQDILEDFHADLPGLPAFVVYTETECASSGSSTGLDQLDENHVAGTDPSEPIEAAKHNESNRSPSTTKKGSKPNRNGRLFIEISDDES